MDSMSKAGVRTTENVLRTAYFIAKKDRTFSGHPDFLNCKSKKGVILVLVGTHAFVRNLSIFLEILLLFGWTSVCSAFVRVNSPPYGRVLGQI